MKPVTKHIEEQVEAILTLSGYQILTEQKFSNYRDYYLLTDGMLMDHIHINFQDGYFTTSIRSEVWKGHVHGTPEGEITTRKGQLPDGLSMINYDETREDLSKLQEYIKFLAKKYLRYLVK